MEDIVADMPDDDRCQKFADYVVENYIDSDCDFPPSIWAHAPDLQPVTTNGAESYHGHLNSDFQAPHPNIYLFVEALLRQQTATYVSITSVPLPRTVPNAKRERENGCYSVKFTHYTTGELSRRDYIARTGYRLAP